MKVLWHGQKMERNCNARTTKTSAVKMIRFCVITCGRIVASKNMIKSFGTDPELFYCNEL